MLRSRFVSVLTLSTLALSLAACDSLTQKDEAPKTGSLTQRLAMVDKEGRNYGMVELDPINGGKIYDTQGRLIGRVVTPGPVQLAPTAQ